MAPPFVKILLLVFIRWNKYRSYTEKVKYPLFLRNMIGVVKIYLKSCKQVRLKPASEPVCAGWCVARTIYDEAQYKHRKLWTLGRNISFPIFFSTKKTRNKKKLERKSKQQISRLNDLNRLTRNWNKNIRMEIETTNSAFKRLSDAYCLTMRSSCIMR